jgi:hypothetical protein
MDYQPQQETGEHQLDPRPTRQNFQLGKQGSEDSGYEGHGGGIPNDFPK